MQIRYMTEGELIGKVEELMDTPRFGPLDIAYVVERSDRTVQRFLRGMFPDHRGPWRLTRSGMLAVVRAMMQAPEHELCYPDDTAAATGQAP